MSQRCEPGCGGCACHNSPPCNHCTEHICVCGDPNCDEPKCDHDYISALEKQLTAERATHLAQAANLRQQLDNKEKQLFDAISQNPPCRFCSRRDRQDHENDFWKQEVHLLRCELLDKRAALTKHIVICSELEAQRDALLAQRRPWWRFWK
jgi:hypothetical protein